MSAGWRRNARRRKQAGQAVAWMDAFSRRSLCFGPAQRTAPEAPLRSSPGARWGLPAGAPCARALLVLAGRPDGRCAGAGWPTPGLSGAALAAARPLLPGHHRRARSMAMPLLTAARLRVRSSLYEVQVAGVVVASYLRVS